jgi:hypothetical protein
MSVTYHFVPDGVLGRQEQLAGNVPSKMAQPSQPSGLLDNQLIKLGFPLALEQSVQRVEKRFKTTSYMF